MKVIFNGKGLLDRPISSYAKKFYSKDYRDEDLFATKRRLLNQILTNLLSEILKNVFRCPVIAWRKLSITLIALFFVALGYLNINLTESDYTFITKWMTKLLFFSLVLTECIFFGYFGINLMKFSE